jgi:hypothetical protein
MRIERLVVAWLVVLVPACSHGSQDSAAGHAPAPPTPPAFVLGERVTAPDVPLATIAKDPAHYRGQVVATRGNVTAVCREMGCWMEIGDASSHAHVRIHGHSFFVPKTAPGHQARVQAVVLGSDPPAATGDLDCEENTQKVVGKVELEATGVEID